MSNNEFPMDYKVNVMGTIIFINKEGKLDAVDQKNEMLMQDKYTKEYEKCNINEFVQMIKAIFPDKEEQKEILKQMFSNPTES